MSLQKKDAHTYVMEDEDNRLNLSRDDDTRRSRRNSWGSFRRTRPLNLGQPNTAFQGDSPATRVRVSDYSQAPIFNLDLHHDPGESDVGYNNSAYNDSVEILCSPNNKGLTPEVIFRRQSANPMNRAKLLGRDQPGLAGHGALNNLTEVTPIRKPMTPSITPPSTPSGGGSRELSLLPPTFQPEVPWEFPREKLYVRTKVGEGSFGEVWKAKASGILGRRGEVTVAVKMLKGTPSDDNECGISLRQGSVSLR